jgi:hypothetical protein
MALRNWGPWFTKHMDSFRRCAQLGTLKVALRPSAIPTSNDHSRKLRRRSSGRPAGKFFSSSLPIRCILLWDCQKCSLPAYHLWIGKGIPRYDLGYHSVLIALQDLNAICLNNYYIPVVCVPPLECNAPHPSQVCSGNFLTGTNLGQPFTLTWTK